MTSKAKEMAKSVKLRRIIRKGQIKSISIEMILYCIFAILLFAFIFFTVFLSIVEHSKRDPQVKSAVVHLEDFDLTDPNAFILEDSFMDEETLGLPLAFSPYSSSKMAEEKTVSENAIVEEETSVIIAEEERNSSVSALESNSIVPINEEENLTTSALGNDFIIPVTEYEIGLAVQAVQYEVGSEVACYPDADIDEVQQIMARVIVNQVGLPDCGDSIEEVLFLHPGHFMPKEALDGIDPFHERTRKNVLKVLKGEDSYSSKVIYEMSFKPSVTFEYGIEIMESQVGPVKPYFWTISSENRKLIFAEPAEND